MVSCPDGRFTSEMFQTAMENLDLFEGFACVYGAPMSMAVVGTIFYSGFGLNIFLRTGSVMIPFVMLLILGGTILAQMFAVINAFVAIIVLFAAPLVLSGLIFMIDRQG